MEKQIQSIQEMIKTRQEFLNKQEHGSKYYFATLGEIQALNDVLYILTHK